MSTKSQKNGPQPTPDALEGAHTPTEDPYWQESWYFNYSDIQSKSFGITRIGYQPAKGKADGIFLGIIEGTPKICYPAVQRSLSSSKVQVETPKHLITEKLKLSCEAPLKTWKLELKTIQLEIDLTFQAKTPVYIFLPHST